MKVKTTVTLEIEAEKGVCNSYWVNGYLHECITETEGVVSVITKKIETWEPSIAVKWVIDDVMEVAPYLTEDECYEVLKDAYNNHNAEIGINWDVLRITAENLFEDKYKAYKAENHG